METTIRKSALFQRTRRRLFRSFKTQSTTSVITNPLNLTPITPQASSVIFLMVHLVITGSQTSLVIPSRLFSLIIIKTNSTSMILVTSSDGFNRPAVLIIRSIWAGKDTRLWLRLKDNDTPVLSRPSKETWLIYAVPLCLNPGLLTLTW